MDKIAQKKKTEKLNPIVLDFIFAAVLLVLPLIHIAFGVELTDTAYSLGNFENLDKMNITWTVATFWANMLGRFFTNLPFGYTWIGMKFYTALVPVAGVMVSYFFLKNYIPRWIVFIGEILTISLFWCPTTILYNYLSYLLFNIAAIILAVSLIKEKRWGLAIAGVVLAFNVFVRFPNITEVALIVVVWFNAKNTKKKFLYGLTDTLICVGGFTFGMILNVLLIGFRYGFSSLPLMVTSLFSMTGSNAGYKPHQMVFAMFRDYIKYTKPFIFVVGITVLCFAVSAIMKRHFARIITIVAQFLLYGLFIFWGYRNSVFTVKYSEYSSMFFWAVMFFVIGNTGAIWTLLRKRREREHKILALTVLVILWITPLGSNNGLYPSMNNLFIVAPVILFMCYSELFKGRNFHELLDLETKNSMVSTRITVFLLLASILVNCFIFGFTFIFRDSGFPRNNHFEINGNRVLVGMHTNAERKAIIENLTVYVDEHGYENREAIFYGDIPGLEYILKMPCAISHTWPDLGSFSYKEFESDIEGLTEPPIIFVNKDYCSNILNPGEEASDKDICLSKYMTDNEYILKAKIENIEIYSTK